MSGHATNMRGVHNRQIERLRKEMEPDVVWKAQPGSQEAFLNCPVFEVLYEGTRGPGKTDTLLMDFAQHCGVGWGRDWRGILFRQTFPQLDDVIAKTQKWFPQIFPNAKYNKVEHKWTWPDGEELLLRHMKDPSGYWSYHGHAYPWIGWEELTNWPDDTCYLTMMSCSRSTVADDKRDKFGRTMPRKYRATTNPYGVGHNWVKRRFRLPQMRGRVIRDSMKDGDLEPPRVAIYGNIFENQILLKAEPDYIAKVRSAAQNPAQLEAWLRGSWDVTSGGMFDDIWTSEIHVIPDLNASDIPAGWRLDRSFDWGSAKPFSVGWWAQSNGEAVVIDGRRIGGVKGDLIRVWEWYGWNGTRNQGSRMTAEDIAIGILEREQFDFGVKGRVKKGPADSSIFDEENGRCIAKDMAQRGVRWDKADKGPGSRLQGWEILRRLLKGSIPEQPEKPREKPGFFVCRRCIQFLETFPSLPRDEVRPDDVDTDAEDHAADDARYRARHRLREVSGTDF